VTWSYSDRYVGWAPLPPSFACGSSGYSGRAVVLSSSQYVFVPTNRFVDTEVDSIWLPSTQNPAVFRQTRPVTNFAVSDGAFRNVGVPIAAIQSAVGSRIETRNISAASTAPEPVAAGGGGKGRRMSIVSPAREVNAAVAAGPREAAPVEQRQPKAQKFREAPPAQAREAAPMEQRQPKAPKAEKFREAPPAPAREAPPIEQRQPKAPKEQKVREVPPGQPQRQAPQAAPMEQRQAKPPKEQKGREAPPAQPQAAQPAPAPAAQAAPPNPEPAREKPAKPEKDKKEKDKKDN